MMTSENVETPYIFLTFLKFLKILFKKSFLQVL